MASAVSFQGLSTNLQTDALVSAIINQESQPMVRMQTRQATNNTKQAALQVLSTDLASLSASMDSLTLGGFAGNTVTSSDATGANATATATGAAPGAYDVTVNKLATRARLVLPTAMQPAAAVGTGTYAITDMSGNTFNVTIDSSNNSLAGLAAAINGAKTASGTAIDINASVIQTGTDGSSQLVLSANKTGTTSAGATFTFTPPAGSALTTGSGASSTATNAEFVLNGVTLTRASNSVSDAVAGVTFNLNQANPDKTTTFTVAQDQGAATKALQAVVDGFNKFYKDYKDKNSFTRNTDGSYTQGVFNMDMTVRNMVSMVAQALMGTPKGLTSTATFQSASEVGLKTNQDGTITLDTAAFTAALTKDAGSVANLFQNSASSSNPLISYVGSGSNTTNSPIDISVATVQGVLTGTFSAKAADGSTQTSTLTSTNGYFYGTAGTLFEGLVVKATDGATGTLNVSTGLSRQLQDLVFQLRDSNPGDLGGLISDLNTSNHNLQLQIDQQQNFLDASRASLQKIYSNLESTVGALQSAGQSLSSL